MEYQAAIPSLVTNTGNDGFGMGGGLLGGLVLGSLFRGGNNFGGYGGGYAPSMTGYGDGCVTPSLLAASLANVTDTQMNTEVLNGLGDIKAAIPLAEAQVQLALAGAQADLNSNIFNASSSINANIATGLQTAIQGQAGINKNISDAIATSLASQGAIKETVLTSAAANMQATMQAKFDLSQAISADGEKTREILRSQNEATLNRLLTERQDEIIELRNEGRRRDDRHGIEINMTNIQTQQQLQAQAQQQQINSLFGCLHGIDQNIRATNQQLIIGNTGVTTGGPQTSNPTNVKA